MSLHLLSDVLGNMLGAPSFYLYYPMSTITYLLGILSFTDAVAL
jgi:hypothetical protein